MKRSQYRKIPVLTSQIPVFYRPRYWIFNAELETLLIAYWGAIKSRNHFLGYTNFVGAKVGVLRASHKIFLSLTGKFE
jgi:hypothetical protein